ncbi:hypothetical protein DPMN_028023 [Dreissena polymorpha]|uniref:Uncharacterized protein n=1 Tax=Dreissena polymorpha TaxID=45954 RepID=A0A9D4RG29_DREPO|nr:hypothetical protein DPMN_028023 [Dreissena polymorpha]
MSLVTHLLVTVEQDVRVAGKGLRAIKPATTDGTAKTVLPNVVIVLTTLPVIRLPVCVQMDVPQDTKVLSALM